MVLELVKQFFQAFLARDKSRLLLGNDWNGSGFISVFDYAGNSALRAGRRRASAGAS